MRVVWFMMALEIICDFASLRTCMECQVPDWLSWGNVGSRRLQQTSRAQGKRNDRSPVCGRARWGRLVSRSMSSAGDVNEDGRVLRYENGECESPWRNWKVIIEDRTWISNLLILWKCWKIFEVICEEIRLILRRRSLTPESGSSIEIGLIVHYACTK